MTRLEIISEGKDVNHMYLAMMEAVQPYTRFWHGLPEFTSIELKPDKFMWQAIVTFQRPVFSIIAKAIWIVKCGRCKAILIANDLPTYVSIQSGMPGFAPQTMITAVDKPNEFIRVSNIVITLSAQDRNCEFVANIEKWELEGHCV